MGYKMKVTKSQLKQIIKEELSKALNEGYRSGPTDPVDGGSGFSSDPRQRTPEEERAHKAQVAADRAKEPKTPFQIAKDKIGDDAVVAIEKKVGEELLAGKDFDYHDEVKKRIEDAAALKP